MASSHDERRLLEASWDPRPPPPPSTPPPCIHLSNVSVSFDRLYEHYDIELEAAKQAARFIDLPVWTFSGAVFYTLTLITTIGYGAFAPSTIAGRVLTVVLGLTGIIVTTAGLGIYIATLDAYLERVVMWCFWRQSSSPAAILRLKLCAATILLVCYMLVLAGFGIGHCGPTAPSSFGDASLGDALYYAFQTVSTVGLGDIYCGDVRLADAVAQIVLILPGLVAFSEFLNLAVEAWELLLADAMGGFARSTAASTHLHE